jgi:hypothetical protein
MRSLFLVPIALLGFIGNAWAWGDEGHKIVCEIAMRLALPNTRAEIRRLIKGDEEFDFFRDSCTWPDHPRKRAPDHFINLPRDSQGLTANTCPGNGECVLRAIQTDFAVLKSDDASDDERLASLKFLGHWVGDIHQPLHVSFEDDRGGNEITVSGECNGKLHAAWDTCLVQIGVGESVVAAANDLVKSITPAKREKWVHAELFEWANESFAIAEGAKAKYCVRQGNSCDAPPSGSVRIDERYVDANVPLIREQLQKAGVRLAHLLDEALGKGSAGERD